MENLYDFQ